MHRGPTENFRQEEPSYHRLLGGSLPPLFSIPQNQGKTKVLLVLPTMASMVQSADKLFEIPFDTSYHAKQAATVMLLCTPFLPVPPSYNFTVFKFNAPHLKQIFQSAQTIT